MSTPRLLACLLLSSLLGCAPGGPADPGDGVCSQWVGFEEGLVWTYQTTNEEETFTWTQSLARDADGFWILSSDQPDADSEATYRCNAGALELLSTRATTADGVASEDYDPPFMVWPSDEPSVGLSWVSTSTITASFDGQAAITVTQSKTDQWEITEANVEAITDEGDTWPNSVVFNHSTATRQDDMEITSTDELQITSLDGPGLVWVDSVTTTAGGTAESFTELLSAE